MSIIKVPIKSDQFDWVMSTLGQLHWVMSTLDQLDWVMSTLFVALNIG